MSGVNIMDYELMEARAKEAEAALVEMNYALTGAAKLLRETLNEDQDGYRLAPDLEKRLRAFLVSQGIRAP